MAVSSAVLVTVPLQCVVLRRHALLHCQAVYVLRVCACNEEQKSCQPVVQASALRTSLPPSRAPHTPILAVHARHTHHHHHPAPSIHPSTLTPTQQPHTRTAATHDSSAALPPSLPRSALLAAPLRVLPRAIELRSTRLTAPSLSSAPSPPLPPLPPSSSSACNSSSRSSSSGSAPSSALCPLCTRSDLSLLALLLPPLPSSTSLSPLSSSSAMPRSLPAS